jgi:WD40 repeat protein
VATSSSYGTVVKLFNTTTGECVGQFRRGTLSAEIQGMAFSPESELLAVASSKGTIHFFSIATMSTLDAGNATRSEIKVQHPDFALSTIAFSSSDTLVVGSKSGKLYIVKCSLTEKLARIDSTCSFVELITIAK